MVGVLSNKIGREELKPGDHIYSWRFNCLYCHHGIYIGDHKVIHFTRPNGLISSSPYFSASSSNACQHCADILLQHQPQPETQGPTQGGVIISCLDSFLDGGNLYLFVYSASTAFFLAKSPGTCTMADSDPPDLILHRAHFLLTNGFGAYCLFRNNCEDFAIYCKTGLVKKNFSLSGRSGQITSLGALATSLLVGGLPLYFVYRYRFDIGVRKDVEKVPVERLAEHIRISAQQ